MNKWIRNTRGSGSQRYPHLPAPSGESFQAFEARVLEEVHRLLDGNPGPIAVVTHGGVLRVVLQHFCALF